MAVKRTTAQEKCNILLAIFQEKREFFQAKEIEKIAAKKGLNEKAFKDTLKNLLDENLVTSEKLGISNYFWSFKKDEGRNLQEKEAELKKSKQNLQSELDQTKNLYEAESRTRVQSKEREEMIDMMKQLDVVINKQENEMKHYAECDPRVFESRKEEITKTKVEINKITDDIFELQSYVCNKFGMERKDFNKNFNVDDEMDYVE